MYIKYSCRECGKIYELNKDAVYCHKDKDLASRMVSSCCDSDVTRYGSILRCTKCDESEGKSNVMKDKLNEIERINLQLKKLVYEFNITYHNEGIEFKDSFQIDDDGYNFRVTAVIPEENAIKISYDVFEKNDQIECTDFITLEQFIKHVK